ncbi:hypothetical protein [Shimia sagamensis]|uniref:Uncharacterized protein n=1 Tax=Shimia sagamensis TaxID=1566352 RepID=A0ABY1PCK8_9RHOB|nr:hypothetical protein [Shimia sagamensis]SMP31502.1 hypothetical protein SAMN06265373_1084 [Shimia sagamensis]
MQRFKRRVCPAQLHPPPNFAATLINDGILCGDAAIESYVTWPKGGLCKGRNLRIAAARAARIIRWKVSFLPLPAKALE